MRAQLWLLDEQKPNQRSNDGRGGIQGCVCALTEEERKRWCEDSGLTRKFANDANHEHGFPRASRSLYPQ